MLSSLSILPTMIRGERWIADLNKIGDWQCLLTGIATVEGGCAKDGIYLGDTRQ